MVGLAVRKEVEDGLCLSTHCRLLSQMVGKRLDIKTIPHNYLVDRSGRIIAKNISITLAIDKLKAAIKQEQNGACSDSAEREQARMKFKALLEKEKQQ